MRFFAALVCATCVAATLAEQSCHSISDTVPDDWCDSNCNHVPTNCPESLCQCDTPGPSPPPPAPSPTLEHALKYAESLVGTPYGWWTGGSIPEEEPAWAANGSPPDADYVKGKGCFCAGIPNLMRRDAGLEVPCLHLPTPDPECGQCCGGTGAYGRNFSSKVAMRFDMSSADQYPRGTLLGRKYRSVSDQGHVAILLEPGKDGRILQSFSWCAVEPCPNIMPGVLSNYTLQQAYDTFSFCRFTYAILPENWMPDSSAEFKV